MDTTQTKSYFSVVLRADGIIQITVNTDQEIDVAEIKEIIEAIGKAGNYKKHPTLIYASNSITPTPEARAYLAKSDANPFSIASAFMVKSLQHKLLVNAYLKINKPNRPTKMFTSENQAIEWLKSFL
jgi:hypothetical protein